MLLYYCTIQVQYLCGGIILRIKVFVLVSVTYEYTYIFFSRLQVCYCEDDVGGSNFKHVCAGISTYKYDTYECIFQLYIYVTYIRV